MLLEELLGNDKVKKELKNIVETEKVTHSYLFVGPEGVGKKQFAIALAQMLLCQNKEQKPCTTCKSCIELEGNNHPDFFLLSSEGTIKIDQIRKLQARIIEKPILSDKKVYIMDNSENMTPEAQNCLLKTLEEPPSYMVLILIASNENQVLKTILSRCMKITFDKIPDEAIANYFKKTQQKEVTKQQLLLYEGRIGKALSLQDKEQVYKQIEEQIETMQTTSLLSFWKQAELFSKNKEQIIPILDYMNLLFLEKGKQNINKRVNYLNCIETIEKTKRNLKANSNFDMSIDQLLLKIWEEINE